MTADGSEASEMPPRSTGSPHAASVRVIIQRRLFVPRKKAIVLLPSRMTLGTPPFGNATADLGHVPGVAATGGTVSAPPVLPGRHPLESHTTPAPLAGPLASWGSKPVPSRHSRHQLAPAATQRSIGSRPPNPAVIVQAPMGVKQARFFQKPQPACALGDHNKTVATQMVRSNLQELTESGAGRVCTPSCDITRTLEETTRKAN